MLRNCLLALSFAVVLSGCASNVAHAPSDSKETTFHAEIAKLIDQLADEVQARREAAARKLIEIGNPAVPSLVRVRDGAQTILEEISNRDRRLKRYQDSEFVAVIEVTSEETHYDHGPMMADGPRGSKAEIYGYISKYRARTVRLLKGDELAGEFEFGCYTSLPSRPPLQNGKRYLVGLRKAKDAVSPSEGTERTSLGLSAHLLADSPEARLVENHLKRQGERPRR